MTGMRLPASPPRFVIRPGDRRLAYSEWGDPRGVPVIHFHGMPGSRLELHAPDATYRRLGVRFITVDRPGYGASDRQPRRALLDWPADVSALADALGLDRFGVTALSGGGPYALACAARIPERLTGVGVAGCIAPLDPPGALREMKMLNRLGLLVARRMPSLLVAAYSVLGAVLNRSPDAFLELMTADKPTADVRLLTDLATREQVEIMLQEAIRGGVLGAVEEVSILAGAWGFDVGEISAPVELWHGDLDDTSPIRSVIRMAAQMPRARVHRCPGEGHMVMWTHLPEILAAAQGRETLAAVSA